MSTPSSYTAGGTIPKYAAVSISSGEVVVTTAATADPIGIALDSAVDGDLVPVCEIGHCKAIATDGNIAVGELLSGVADGKVDTNAGTAGHYYFARAREASGADGDYIEVTVLGAVLQDDGT